jgi:hypothetical protein
MDDLKAIGDKGLWINRTLAISACSKTCGNGDCRGIEMLGFTVLGGNEGAD